MLFRTAFIPLLLLSLLPAGTAEPLAVASDSTLGNLVGEPGQDLHFTVNGDLTVFGTMQTIASAEPGSDGPSIHLQVHGTLVLLDGARILAADGRNGEPTIGAGLVQGMDGGHGGSITIEAERLVVQGALLGPGNGGHGGFARSEGGERAIAWGGRGGNAGILLVMNGLAQGTVMMEPGSGGHGGAAEAKGQAGESCGGRDGNPRLAWGQNATVLGHGGDANATADPGGCGPVDGSGGNGGTAEAYGGHGGTAPDGNGGHGGNATAYGGRGGDGMDACFTSTDAAIDSGIIQAGNGGFGGSATAFGGNGGNGLNGGHGGSAYAATEGGWGGNATQPILFGNGGGVNVEGAGVKGGDGGIGAAGIGGSGGNALGETKGGGGGGHCGPLPSRGLYVPMAGMLPLVALVILTAVVQSRKLR